MPIDTETADLLKSFARTLPSKTYAERMAAIAAEAHERFGVILRLQDLVDIAGGGSFRSAQEALRKLNLSAGQRVSSQMIFSASIPERVKTLLDDAISQIWIVCRQEARAEVEGEKDELQTRIEQLTARHEDLVLQLQKARLDGDAMAARASELQGHIADYQVRLAGREGQLQAARDEARELTAKMAQQEVTIALLNERLVAAGEDRAALLASFAEERQQTRNANMVDLDRVRTEAREAARQAAAELAQTKQRLDAEVEVRIRTDIQVAGLGEELSRARSALIDQEARAADAMRRAEASQAALAAQAQEAQQEAKAAAAQASTTNTELERQLAAVRATLDAVTQERDRLLARSEKRSAK